MSVSMKHNFRYSNMFLRSWNSIAEPAGGTQGSRIVFGGQHRPHRGRQRRQRAPVQAGPQASLRQPTVGSRHRMGAIFCSHADDAHDSSWFRSRSESQSSRPDQYEHCRSSGQARGEKGRKGCEWWKTRRKIDNILFLTTVCAKMFLIKATHAPMLDQPSHFLFPFSHRRNLGGFVPNKIFVGGVPITVTEDLVSQFAIKVHDGWKVILTWETKLGPRTTQNHAEARILNLDLPCSLIIHLPSSPPFATNLPRNNVSQNLQEQFKQCFSTYGGITKVELHALRGFGYITYETVEVLKGLAMGVGWLVWTMMGSGVLNAKQSDFFKQLT